MADLRDHPAIDQRPAHETPDSPREELAALIAARLEWLDQSADEASLTYRQIARQLVEAFTSVVDEWQPTDGSAFGDPAGTHVLHQRYLVARLWRQDVPLRRGTDRSVGE